MLYAFKITDYKILPGIYGPLFMSVTRFARLNMLFAAPVNKNILVILHNQMLVWIEFD